ncbi:hypothetical protein [Thermococcus sp. AM4]|uniref:hypothetical protein n=1 Tax=Thermococcus sp. (strain AM4) TaxID=246969 RepID=UPI000186F82B|nr:hypothetical protein [Thermococcus sp. AM4]EEB74708.1 hypothetical protein TAM4_653 [Thermococcus sp. AM4]
MSAVKYLLVFTIVLVFVAPTVNAAKVVCPREIDLEKTSELICHVYGKGNASVRVIYINGVNLSRSGSSYLYAYDFRGEYLDRGEAGKMPLKLRVFMSWLIELSPPRTAEGLYWVYYNKVNHVGFLISEENGSEIVDVPVYVKGSVWDELRYFLYIGLLGVLVLLVLYLISLLRGRNKKAEKAAESITKIGYFFLVMGSTKILKVFAAGLVYYLGRSGLDVPSDLVLSWSSVILGMLLLTVLDLAKTPPERRKQTWLTGLEWIPVSLYMLSIKMALLSFLFLVVYLVLVRIKPLVEGMRRVSLLASPLWAILLYGYVGGEAVFFGLLLFLSLLIPYLIHVLIPGEDEGFVEEDGIIRVYGTSPTVIAESLPVRDEIPLIDEPKKKKVLNTEPPTAKELVARFEWVIRDREFENKYLKNNRTSEDLPDVPESSPDSNRVFSLEHYTGYLGIGGERGE